MPMRALLSALLLAVPTAVLAAPADLQTGAERFARAAVTLDARLGRRDCPPEGFLFAWAGAAVEARCPATGERILIPLSATAGQPRLKRGESVQADVIGSGFRLSVGAVAESAGQDGRLTLRNSRSGQRFAARMDQSGKIFASEAGY
jgi:hypothetical protein